MQTLISQRFTIQQILSDHGTGQLARALDGRTGLPVVVRIFKCASEEERQSVESLLKVLAELRHPNIEVVHEIVREGPDLVVVTEEPEGASLSEVVADGPLSVDEFKVVVVQVLSALSAAHQKGAVHGALNAGHVLIKRKPGEPWKAVVTGYGVGFGDAGKTGEVSAYLCVPPEQWEQKPARRRSDVYSIGCVFYQALSGRSPFNGKTLKEVRHKHVHHDLRPLDQVAQQAPAWLCKWVMSLLTASADQRMESATAALDRYRTAEVSRNVQTQCVPSRSVEGSGEYATTGFVKVAGSAFFRVPNVATQTISPMPVDPQILTARHVSAAQPHRKTKPAKPLPSPARTPGRAPTSEEKSNQKQWIIIGSVAACLVGLVAFLMRGDGQPTGLVKVAANPPKASSIPVKAAGKAPGNDLPPVTAGYPAGRQKPVNFAGLVLHTMCDGDIMSTRMDREKKRLPAAVNDQVYSWRDYAGRGRDNSLAFPSDQGSTHPKLISKKPDATFPLARERRFIRFDGEGSPAAALVAFAKTQIRDFPFDSATPPTTRGLTFAAVFFQEVKGRQQTLFHLSSQHGSAALRLGEKGELRFNGRQNGIPDDQQHPTIFIGADKFNPVEPLLVTGVWRAEPAQAQLRVRSASGYSFQTALFTAPVPNDALGNVLIGRDAIPGPASKSKAVDAKSLRAFSGGIAEILVYSTGLNEAELKSLEDQLAGYYFPPVKS